MTIVITRLFDSSFDKTWTLMQSCFQFSGLVNRLCHIVLLCIMLPQSATLYHTAPFFNSCIENIYTISYVKCFIAFYDLTPQSEHHFSSAIIWRTRTALPYIVLQSNLLPTFLLLTFDKSAGSSASMQ